MHYHDEGTGEPPLVLLHGWCDDADIWAPIVALLARDYRCLVPDMRGHGRSSVPLDHAFFLDALTSDVRAICEAAGAVEPVLIGHSYGGLLAAEIARRFPGFARAVVVVDQALDVAKLWGDAVSQGVDAAIRSPDTHMTFRIGLKRSLMPSTTPTWLVDEVIAGAERTSVEVGLALWAMLYERTPAELAAWDRSLQDALGTVPSLSVDRQEWPTYHAQLRARAPGVEIQVRPGSHWLHLEDPEAFAALIREFVGRVCVRPR